MPFFLYPRDGTTVTCHRLWPWRPLSSRIWCLVVWLHKKLLFLGCPARGNIGKLYTYVPQKLHSNLGSFGIPLLWFFNVRSGNQPAQKGCGLPSHPTPLLWYRCYLFFIPSTYVVVSYMVADKSLARPDRKKNNWKVAIFRPTRRSLLPRRPGWTDSLLNFFFFEWLAKEFGRCSLIPS